MELGGREREELGQCIRSDSGQRLRLPKAVTTTGYRGILLSSRACGAGSAWTGMDLPRGAMDSGTRVGVQGPQVSG